MHIWTGAGGAEFTVNENLHWAFCVPVTDDASLGWCLYVAGAGGRSDQVFVTEEDLRSDLRFTGLVAHFMGSVRQVRALQEQRTKLSSFFSPNVVNSLKSRTSLELLEPSERNITVLFCDVHGFSRKAEDSRDNLHLLLDSVRAALSAMTGPILERDGTIADFQGDAALGFWGWPVPLEDGPLSACLAALDIQADFLNNSGDDGSLKGFRIGIGVAHGRAIAGQIGSNQQAKVGVFGPVVNQGARLEGLTRQIGVGICIDESTADCVNRLLPPDQARTRRLVRLRPKGMDTPLSVYELLPPHGAGSDVTDETIRDHEAAVDAVVAGHWSQAARLLEALPPSGPRDFLLQQMERHGRQVPTDWDGAFTMVEK